MSMLETKEFIVDQKLLSIRNTYVIKNRQSQELGFAKQEFLKVGPHFWFEDKSGDRIGEIEGKVLTLHHEYAIKDASGKVEAKVKKKLMKVFGSEWWMEDAKGNDIAVIDGNIFNHDYKMMTPDKTIIAKIHRQWVSLRDEYCIEIVSPDFSPLLVLGYAIAMDHVEQEKQKGKSSMK